MNLGSEDKAEARFTAYVEGLASVMGHADRNGPLRDYCTGLILPGERKSVEPMAAKTAPARTAAQHQSLLHFVGIASWSDEKVLAKVREMVLPAMTRQGPIEAWIIDDTAFPKQGTHSVGVCHQYCGQLGNPSRPSIGCRRCHPISDSASSSTSPNCAGVSSGTIRSSSRKSGLGTSKAAGGAASIITPRCASQPTDS
jgi:SRSO17 transposase